MNCVEFERHLHAYVDGELAVSEMLAADAHLAACVECRALAARERRFRQLLRWQPREQLAEAALSGGQRGLPGGSTGLSS